ncbi:MAG: hypothetical protein CVU57_00465 [Deltaproteobacteria bacterium HGW-Deltaproteobacteria-15]|jgi:hypothetical protein|nr:MAG: hypothetical protein CVU57_00465 [Deltaproteobacteria bacterium HGW-Deltaproteobacteria-15]
MISADTSEKILHISPPDILAKDMLVSASCREKTNTDLVHLSRTLGFSALLREAVAPRTHSWPAVCPQGRRLRLNEPPGAQIIEPVVLGDGSILASIKPSGRLVLLREDESSPLPMEAAPFPVRAKAVRDGICHLLEQDGSRIYMVDSDLRPVGVTDALTKAGVERPTSLCFYGDFVGVLSWPRKEAWILDANWKSVARARLPWVDFLCHPVGVGSTLIAVDTPFCSQGPGGVVAVPLDGRPFSLFDALPVPLGLCSCGHFFVCGHSRGLALFSFTGTKAFYLGDIPTHSMGIPLKNDERLAITYVRQFGENLLLLCDVMIAGVSGTKSTWIVKIPRSGCVPSTDGTPFQNRKEPG